jgi:hypothetical protein
MKNNKNYNLQELKWFYSRNLDKPVLDKDFLFSVKASCFDTLHVWYSRYRIMKTFSIILVFGSVALFLIGIPALSIIGGFLVLVTTITGIYYWNWYRNNPPETSIRSTLAIASAVLQEEKEKQVERNSNNK